MRLPRNGETMQPRGIHSPQRSDTRPPWLTMSAKPRIRWAQALLAALPASALVAHASRVWLGDHALISTVLIIFYEIGLGLSALTGKVLIKLQEIWAERLARSIDERMTSRLSRYRSRYLQYLGELHHDDDLTGIPIRAPFSLPLAQVYVDLSLVSQPIHKLSPNLLPAGGRRQSICQTGGQSASRRESIWQYIPEKRRSLIAIVGAPGSGKTTLLRHVTLSLADSRRVTNGRRTVSRMIPVLLYLREHAEFISKNQDATLPEVISRSLRHIAARSPTIWFETRLKSGNCLVMLDGLDEVALQDTRRIVVQWTERQIASYPRCSFIITSRPNGYLETPVNAATVLQVRALSQSQIEQFVHQWSLAAAQKHAGRQSEVVRYQAEQKAVDLLNRMESADAIQDLCANPLLLTMIVHLHNYHDTLPGSRVQLYREICQVLLGKRQEAKGLGPGLLTPDQKELVLRHLALAMMRTRRRDIPQEEAELLITGPLARVKPDLPAEKYLIDIQQSSGILVEREHGVLAFVHQTLQEYLAATRLHEQRDLEVLKENVNDIWWRETTLLYCAQSNAGSIVRACLNSRTAIALALAAECAEIALELDPVVRQAVDSALSGQQISDDPIARRVVTAALMARKLRCVTRLDHGTHLVNAPITWSEYLSFVSDRRRGGENTAQSEWRGMRSLSGMSGIATGIDDVEAAMFGSWVTELVSDGWSYRLPRTGELTSRTISRSLNLCEYGYWLIDQSSRLGTKVLINPEASTINVRGLEVYGAIINGFNWHAITSAIRGGLTPAGRRRLRARWHGQTPGEAGALPDDSGSVDELLKLVLFLGCLDKDSQLTTLQLIRHRRLSYSELTSFLELAELLEQKELYTLAPRQLTDLQAPSHVDWKINPINPRAALFGCLAYQLRCDLRLIDGEHHNAFIGDEGFSFVNPAVPSARNPDQYGLSCALDLMKAYVDRKRLVDLAQHGRLMLHREAVRASLPRLDGSSLERFTFLADFISVRIEDLFRDDCYVSPRASARLRVSVAMCNGFALSSGRDPKNPRAGGGPWASRFTEMYSAILAGVIVREWISRGYIHSIEGLLLVRE